MIEEKRMASLREATNKLREINKFLDDLYQELDDDIMILPERQWWGPIENDISSVMGCIEEACEDIDNSTDKLTQITGEEVSLEQDVPPLPATLPTQKEVFARRRQRAAEVRKQRGL
jgi:peptidoglycan hydrolase CwlO-like protein